LPGGVPDCEKTAKLTMSELTNHYTSIYKPPKTNLFRASLNGTWRMQFTFLKEKEMKQAMTKIPVVLSMFFVFMAISSIIKEALK
jgi:hypothetical protein